MKIKKTSISGPSFFKDLSPEKKVETLFRQHYTTLCRSLYVIVKDKDIIEDIVQEVFLKVWDRRDQLEMNEATQSYLFKACYHAALNYLKLEKKKTSIDTLSHFQSSDFSEKDLLVKETENLIENALNALPPKTKLVFSMSRFEEMTYKEIAEKLEISVKAVEKHMGIALLRLRESLKEVIYVFVIGIIDIIIRYI